MIENLSLGNIRIVLKGEKAFSISQIGNIFILIEKIYKKFSKNLLEETNLSLTIKNFELKQGAFDLVILNSDNYPIKYTDFEELTLCVLYSIYSSTFENTLEAIDEQAKAIQSDSLGIMGLLLPTQLVVLVAVINDKIVKITISPDKKVFLEKINPFQAKISLKNKEDILNVYSNNKARSFNKCNFEQFELADINLSGASFIDSELSEANFNNSILVHTNFFNADVSNSQLVNAQLNNSILEESDFSGANLLGANLTATNLREADFSSANLSEAILHNVDIEGTDFSGAKFNNAVISGNTKFSNSTDFSNNANWWDAKIEDNRLLEWLKKHYAKD